VRDLIDFLQQRWGKRDSVRGIRLSNAQGHATLFDGRTCYDYCYFNVAGANYRTDRANFWSLR